MRAVIRRSSPTVSWRTASARSASAIAALALAARERPGARAAQEDRRDEQAKLVDLAGVDERAGEPGAALDQERGDLAPPELGQRRDHAGDRIAVDDEDVHSGIAERIDPLGRSVGGGDQKDGRLGGARDHRRVGGQAGGRVEDDAESAGGWRADRGRAR